MPFNVEEEFERLFGSAAAEEALDLAEAARLSVRPMGLCSVAVIGFVAASLDSVGLTQSARQAFHALCPAATIVLTAALVGGKTSLLHHFVCRDLRLEINELSAKLVSMRPQSDASRQASIDRILSNLEMRSVELIQRRRKGWRAILKLVFGLFDGATPQAGASHHRLGQADTQAQRSVEHERPSQIEPSPRAAAQIDEDFGVHTEDPSATVNPAIDSGN